MKTKLIGRHAKDCYAVKAVRSGNWDSPWSIARHVFRNFAGNDVKRGGSHSWISFSCNCPHCPAEMLVREDDVLALVPHGFTEGKRTS